MTVQCIRGLHARHAACMQKDSQSGSDIAGMTCRRWRRESICLVSEAGDWECICLVSEAAEAGDWRWHDGLQEGPH